MIFDFVIIGQGLAGSLLGYELLKAGKKVLIVNAFEGDICSHAGAGIMHPVTGRRLVKHWKADTLIPFAKKKYRELENELGNKLFYEMPILEVYTSIKNRNDWMGRSSEQGFEAYMGEEASAASLEKYYETDAGGIFINGSGYLDMQALMDSLYEFFQMKNAYLKDFFREKSVDFEDGYAVWGDIFSRLIIDCTGWDAADSRFFKHLPFLPVKGEILDIYCKDLPQDYIVNREMFVLPVGNHRFRVGSTYEWDFKHDLTTEKGKEEITGFLEKFLKMKYEITDHKAGVRPATQDRRPFIGIHPEHPNIGIFNGLGTKGAMLAPYYAKQFADFLTTGSAIDEEVNVRRAF